MNGSVKKKKIYLYRSYMAAPPKAELCTFLARASIQSKSPNDTSYKRSGENKNAKNASGRSMMLQETLF